MYGMTNRFVFCSFSVIAGWDMVTKRVLERYDTAVPKVKMKALSESEGNGVFNSVDEKAQM